MRVTTCYQSWKRGSKHWDSLTHVLSMWDLSKEMANIKRKASFPAQWVQKKNQGHTTHRIQVEHSCIHCVKRICPPETLSKFVGVTRLSMSNIRYFDASSSMYVHFTHKVYSCFVSLHDATFHSHKMCKASIQNIGKVNNTTTKNFTDPHEVFVALPYSHTNRYLEPRKWWQGFDPWGEGNGLQIQEPSNLNDQCRSPLEVELVSGIQGHHPRQRFPVQLVLSRENALKILCHPQVKSS